MSSSSSRAVSIEDLAIARGVDFEYGRVAERGGQTLCHAKLNLLQTSSGECGMHYRCTMARDTKDYAALATLFSTSDVCPLNRYRELQIRNLLYYQAELAHLQQELHAIEDKDGSPSTEHVTSRWTLEMAGSTAGSVQTMNTKYSNKMLQIRRTLKDYSRFPACYEQVAAPDPADIVAERKI